mmetsp:Transcript_35409/g.83932  ORF Transcript_35409/g.83932 Transcript_35409/m.83932 type:complete len:202 (+) Transcript_35409:944-1549(+)
MAGPPPRLACPRGRACRVVLHTAPARPCLHGRLFPARHHARPQCRGELQGRPPRRRKPPTMPQTGHAARFRPSRHDRGSGGCRVARPGRPRTGTWGQTRRRAARPWQCATPAAPRLEPCARLRGRGRRRPLLAQTETSIPGRGRCASSLRGTAPSQTQTRRSAGMTQIAPELREAGACGASSSRTRVPGASPRQFRSSGRH